jgi:hypothetical protein
VLIPIINIVVGGALAIGGAMGELTFFGTGSTGAAVAIGAAIAGLGVIQLVRAARRR